MRHSGLPLAIAGSHASTHTLPEHRRAQNADHLAHNTPFSAFFTKVVCDLGATPPQVAASPSPIGGIALHEPPTRRRHAARRLRVVQTPTTAGVEGTGGAGGHGRLRDAGQAAAPVGGRQGLAGLRGYAPSEARGADSERAGSRARAHKAARPGTTARGPLHPLRAAAPVTGRCTRSEGVHCLRIGCSTPNHKNKRGICETTADDLTGFIDERTKGRNCHKAHNVWTRADTTQPREHASSRGHPGASITNGRPVQWAIASVATKLTKTSSRTSLNPVSDRTSKPATEISHSLSISMPGTRVWRPPAYRCYLRQRFF